MSTADEINALVSEEDEVDYLVKHYPELTGHEEELLDTIVMIKIEVLGKYKNRIEIIRKISGRERRKKRDEKKKLEQLQKKHTGISTEEGICEIDKDLAIKKQGNRKQVIAHSVAAALKEFWIYVLQHENFYYGKKQNNHEDLAQDFVDLFLKVVFRGESKFGFEKALTDLSDPKRTKEYFSK